MKIAITGLGMISSIGRDAVTSCASARAGITRESNLTTLNFAGDQIWGNEPVVGHSVGFIAEGFTGLGKLIRLGSLALKDLMRQTNIDERDLERIGIYINLSDKYFEDFQANFEHTEMDHDANENFTPPSTNWKEMTRQVIPRITELCGLDIPSANQAVYYGNHAGCLHAILEGVRNIIAGHIDHCIVGGIDSCIEPSYLIAAALNGLLKTGANTIGFIPGEAAAFILIERLDYVLSHGAAIGGLFEDHALDKDECHRLSGDNSTGIALAKVIEKSISNLNGQEQQIGLVIGDLNGDPFRSKEWGYAVVRLSQFIRIGNLPLWIPALSFGEIGAATGLVSICLGIRAFERHYASTKDILIWVSSDSGCKGAFRLKSYSN